MDSFSAAEHARGRAGAAPGSRRTSTLQDPPLVPPPALEGDPALAALTPSPSPPLAASDRKSASGEADTLNDVYEGSVRQSDALAAAEQALRAADPLCLEANALYSELRLLVEQSVILWARLTFLDRALATELAAVDAAAAAVQRCAAGTGAECARRVSQLRSHQARLDALLAELARVPLDPALAGGDDLGAFVHAESIAEIRAQAAALLASLETSRGELERAPHPLAVGLAELRRARPSLPVVVARDTPRRLARISEKASAAARAATAELVALTAHFDAARAGGADAVAGESPQAALARLRAHRAELRQRNKESQRVQHSLASTFAQFDEFASRAAAFVASPCERALAAVEAAAAECRGLFAQGDAVAAELDALAEYYRLFRQAYAALLGELARRHDADVQLRRFVEQVRHSLGQFHARERDARAQFLKSHGEYLPEQLLSPLADAPGRFKIELESEGANDDAREQTPGGGAF